MSEWECSNLEELAYIDNENISNITDGNFNFYYIDISSVCGTKINMPLNKISFKNAPSRARRIVKRGDVLMSTVRPNLKAFSYFDHTNENCIASTGFAVLTAKVNADSRFILYSILSDDISRQIDALVVGSNYPAISSTDVKKLKIQYPPLLQQQKIARILSTVDAVIEKTEAAIAKYKAIKAGMMHDLFTRGIDDNGQLRPTYEDSPERYKQTALGWIPKEWDVDKLENITSLITDGSHFSPVPRDNGFLIGNVKDMGEYDFLYENCTKISKADFEILKRQNCKPIKDDVLLSKDGTIGRVLLSKGDREMVLLSSIAIIRSKDLINPIFLSHILKSFYFHVQLYALQSGSALKRIVLSDIKKLNIPFPKDINEQLKIAFKVNGLDKKIHAEQITLNKYQKIKQGLMQDLLTGKVKVSIDSTH
jgi:type I restriction enzyme S subunit